MAAKSAEVKSPQKRSGFLKGVRYEWKKIIWPTKKELINYSAMVILISVIVALVVWGIDKVLLYLLSFIVG